LCAASPASVTFGQSGEEVQSISGFHIVTGSTWSCKIGRDIETSTFPGLSVSQGFFLNKINFGLLIVKVFGMRAAGLGETLLEKECGWIVGVSYVLNCGHPAHVHGVGSRCGR